MKLSNHEHVYIVDKLLSLINVASGGVFARLRRLDRLKPTRIQARGDTSGAWTSDAECVSDTTTRKAVLIESIAFTSGCWRVHNGIAAFDVTIEDESFLARVKVGEPFGNADVLVVDLRQVQYFDDGGLITESSIVKVWEHRCRWRQSHIEIITRNQQVTERHVSH